jgi:signal transduction histidine kinase
VRLSTFIEQNAGAVVASAEEFCGTLLPAAGHLDSEALRDHLPKILDAIVKDLRQAQTPAEELRKSRGAAPLIPDAPETAAQTHAMLRAQAGFDIGQMVSEYRALRASVLRLWQVRVGSLDAESLADMQRFNEAIDQALAESVSHFSAEAERWRNIFLAVLGHDLRGPLNAVLLTAELLSRIGSGEPTTEYTARLIRSGKRMKALLDSLLDYSRSSLGRGIAIQRTRVDLAAACEEELDVLRAALPDHRMDLVTTGVVEGAFDVSRVRESLANLVLNAARYGTEGTPISVLLSGTMGSVTLSVGNDGAPIPDELLPSLFEPLRRGRMDAASTPPGHPNLGLGLFIVHEVAVAHGGGVEVTSGAGRTTFAMTLAHPAAEAQSPQEPVEKRRTD